MNISKDSIRTWLDRGKRLYKATHVVILIDYLYSDYYPLFVLEWETVDSRISEYTKLARYEISEIYNLSMDFEEQLSQERAYNL